MQLVTSSLVALLSAVMLASSPFAAADNSPSLVYTYQFNPSDAAGVNGNVQVQYPSVDATNAKVSVDLDFSQFDLEKLKVFDGNCTNQVTKFKWHIHVKWGSTKLSDSFAQCSKKLTSNHYDPLHACGPNSEFADDPAICPPEQIAKYVCNPGNYSQNPLACEKGDLGGKFGDIDLSKDNSKKFTASWTDPNFPKISEVTPQWNMILHAVCENKQTPRLACALAQESNPIKNATTTAAPTGSVPATSKPLCQ